MEQKTFGCNAGFSMPELLVVVAAVCIILASAVPFVDTIIDQYNVVLAAQGLSSQMQYARMRAVSSNETFCVRFGPMANGYRIETENGAVHAGPFQFPPGITFNNDDGGDPVSFPGDQVLFMPNGSLPTSGLGSAGRVKLISRTGLRIDVLVDGGGLIRQTPAYTDSTPPF